MSRTEVNYGYDQLLLMIRSELLRSPSAVTQDRQPWHWTRNCESAFKEAKNLFVTAPVLAHYDPDLPLILAADASVYGLGAVLSHSFPDRYKWPLAFASCTLSSSEKNHSQVEKEALALMFGISKFHQYIYGRQFTLLTDHQPLLSILGPKQRAAARMKHWALILSAYTYTIAYRLTKDHANAEGRSSELRLLELGNRDIPEKGMLIVMCFLLHLLILDSFSSIYMECAGRAEYAVCD